MRASCHPLDGVARAASEIKRMLYEDFGVDPDADHPCIVIATPPLDDMPRHRIITLTVLVDDGGKRGDA